MTMLTVIKTKCPYIYERKLKFQSTWWVYLHASSTHQILHSIGNVPGQRSTQSLTD